MDDNTSSSGNGGRRTEDWNIWRILFPEALPSPRLLRAYLAGLLATTVLGELIANVFQGLSFPLPMWPLLAIIIIAPGLVCFGAAACLLLLVPLYWLRPWEWIASVPLGLVLVAASYLAAYILYEAERRRTARRVPEFRIPETAAQKSGMVWTLGPGTLEHLKFAIEHHRMGKRQLRVWLIAQESNPGVESNLEQITQWAQNLDSAVIIDPVRIGDTTAQDTYSAMTEALERARLHGIMPADIAVDITSGTKLMATGVVFAAMEYGCDLEFVDAEYPRVKGNDGQMRTVVTPTEVQSLVTTFTVKREH